MATTRVYELAKEFGISSKEVMQRLRHYGFEIATHMSFVPSDGVERIRRDFAHTTGTQTVSAEQKLDLSSQKSAPSVRGRVSVPPVASIPVEEEGLVVTPMTVGEFAERTHVLLSDIIISLLRNSIAASKNQVISEEQVAWLAQKHGIKIRSKNVLPSTSAEPRSYGTRETVGGVKRQPVVVIVGHVDHGKTTLLDTIRKTHVASREKGGITQHLGAYEATTAHGAITFLDTPGHAAFSMIRSRGVQGADIAVLVVAADDGVKPQTVEALKIVQQSEIPLIVAINKIDKASTAQIESVKRQLTNYGVVPEEWGGQTSFVPISARLDTGVEALLEGIILQAEVMELQADLAAPVVGFILESHVEKGLGAVGTIVTRHGILSVGDYFIAGATEGRVTAMINAQGKRLQSLYPAIPAKIAGFSSMPHVGDELIVTSEKPERVSRMASQLGTERIRGMMVGTDTEKQIRLVIKADTASSLEAIMGSLGLIGEKLKHHIAVIYEGIGSITENDVVRAADAKAHLYGLHVKIEPNARQLARQRHIEVHVYDIIYRLLESIESLAEQERVVEKVSKKVGEAVVLKVFDIKKMGIIAGAQVKSGIFSRDGLVKIFRGKKLVGEGLIKSLQRDRKSVKEVHTGYECAFLVDNFEAWEEGDRVECYVQTLVTA